MSTDADRPSGFLSAFAQSTWKLSRQLHKPRKVAAQAGATGQSGFQLARLHLVAQPCPTLATPYTVACQAPLSMGFSRPEYWSGLPFPSAGDLPDPGIEPTSLALQSDSLPTELWRKHTTTLRKWAAGWSPGDVGSISTLLGYLLSFSTPAAITENSKHSETSWRKTVRHSRIVLPGHSSIQ